MGSEVLAKRIQPELSRGKEPQLQHDSSTNELIRRYRIADGPAKMEGLP